MTERKKLGTVINILSVFFIILAGIIVFLMFASNNVYGSPKIKDTLLVPVRGDNSYGENKGAIAVVDISGKHTEGDFAVFTGSGVVISKDSMAHIGRVKYYIPMLGGAMDFFKTPVGFFICLVLPLAILVNINGVRTVLLIKRGKEIKKAQNSPE